MHTRFLANLLLITIACYSSLNANSSASAQEPGEFTFVKIADTQTLIPSGVGNFTGFQIPQISGNKVVFRGFGSNPYQEGIYLSDNGNLSVVADQNTPAPGGTEGFQLLYDASISGENIAFIGVNNSQIGIYRSLAGNLEIVADRTTAMPDGGGNFTSLSNPQISGENIAVTGYNYTSNMLGIYLYSNNIWNVIANRYTQLPGGVGNFTGFTFNNISGDNVAFMGSGNPVGGLHQEGVYAKIDGNLITIANQSTPIPGGNGNFVGFYAPDISASNLVFRGYSFSQDGIYTFIDGGLHIVADGNTLVPGSTDTFRGFSNAFPAISGRYVAFYNNGVIYTNLGGKLKKVIGTGDLLDGKTIIGVGDLLDLDGDKLAISVQFANYAPAIYLATPYLVGPDIEVSPAAHDFGNVQWGQTSTAMFAISNAGSGELTVSAISLFNALGVFSITSAPALPKTLSAGQSITVEVAFSPKAIQTYTGGLLNIASDDADEPSLDISLSGTGVFADTPSEQVAAVTDYIQDSVVTGELAGVGSGNSADKKVQALINMIEAAGDLLETGQTVEGCQQLADIYLKVDGVIPPPDFVTGPATAGLAGAIQGLRAYYQCP